MFDQLTDTELQELSDTVNRGTLRLYDSSIAQYEAMKDIPYSVTDDRAYNAAWDRADAARGAGGDARDFHVDVLAELRARREAAAAQLARMSG